jgi:UDP-N-acetylmuramoyl-L-alanyl-D-glutamate--2,6-diaminopimelate ligase
MGAEPRGDWREGLPQGRRALGGASLPSRVGAVRHDSRQVEHGDLFVCLRGERADGHEHAARAVEAGAVAIVAEAGRGEALATLGVPVVEVPEGRPALAAIAAAHEGYPARSLSVVGVTGTDGKSTTAFLLLAALEGAGASAGLLSTVESRVAGRRIPPASRLTTPEAPEVQRLLAEMVGAGCTHAIVEATSHGLVQHRLDGVEFNVGVVTTLGVDHLDFHGTREAYHAAKARLFEALPAEGCAVLNADEPEAAAYLAGRTRARVLRYALDGGPAPAADARAEAIEAGARGTRFRLSLRAAAPDAAIDASVPLPGRVNVANALAALTAAHALGLDVERAAAGLAACPGVPGRMERVAEAPVEVIVDYAHTEAALRQLLGTLRAGAAGTAGGGRLLVVFGCAGERGRERRAGMGRAAAELADYAVLTEEDPRSEEPGAILEEIAEAMRAAGAVEGERFERVPDRRAAVARALELARAGDIVVLAGKGHESTIERADGAHPWDEAAVARELIAERLGGSTAAGSTDRAARAAG